MMDNLARKIAAFHQQAQTGGKHIDEMGGILKISVTITRKISPKH
jgi:aminoglycoside phosphotransferase family enzyme